MTVFLVHVPCLAHFKHTKLFWTLDFVLSPGQVAWPIMTAPRPELLWWQIGWQKPAVQTKHRACGVICGMCHFRSFAVGKRLQALYTALRSHWILSALIWVSWKRLMSSFKCCIAGCAHTSRFFIVHGSLHVALLQHRVIVPPGWKRPVWTERSFGHKQS